ncbi:MAG TPA: hypothetical protein VEG38_04100 [Acidimicrobiia bacterium]|nr:hypothetical protein [Acidimicrobiia bacterium]
MTKLTQQQVRSVLTEGRQAYLAVDTRHGPHVTPELYGLIDDYIGMWVATSTLKAKVLRKAKAVGVLVRTASSTVVISGTGEVIDPLRPPLNPGRLVGAGRLTINFTLRNVPDLVAFGRDTLAGATGFPPARRVLILARPESVTTVDTFASDVVVGVRRAEGPLALPGRWLGDDRVELPLEMAGVLAGAADGPVSVTSDDYSEPGPAAKRGVLLRGEGRIAPEGDGLILTVNPTRQTEWKGVHTSTRRVGQA